MGLILLVDEGASRNVEGTKCCPSPSLLPVAAVHTLEERAPLGLARPAKLAAQAGSAAGLCH